MEEKSFDINHHIRLAIAEKKSKETIYGELLSKGCLLNEIETAFNLIANPEINAPAENKPNLEDSIQTKNKAVSTFLSIGVMLIAASIFSFIAANWGGMNRYLKVFVLITSMLASYSIGWWLSENPKLHKTGDKLIFLGTIIYGASIFLIAQTFNIKANWPDGLILWMFGALIVGYAIDSFNHYFFAIALSFTAIVSYILTGVLESTESGAFLKTEFILTLAICVCFIGATIANSRIPEDLREKY